jgi:hypothetical protein
MNQIILIMSNVYHSMQFTINYQQAFARRPAEEGVGEGRMVADIPLLLTLVLTN